MLITCPCCGARQSLEACLQDEAAREAVAAALNLPKPLSGLVIRYLALFRPQKNALSWHKAASVLKELNDVITKGRIKRGGRDWVVTQDMWVAALEQVVSRDGITRPLKSHAYLLEVVAGLANKTEGQSERKKETQAKQRVKVHIAGDANKPTAPVQIGQRLGDMRKKLT